MRHAGRLAAGRAQGIVPAKSGGFDLACHLLRDPQTVVAFSMGSLVNLAQGKLVWPMNLRDYRPIARFGASFHKRTDDCFSIADKSGEAAPQSLRIS